MFIKGSFIINGERLNVKEINNCRLLIKKNESVMLNKLMFKQIHWFVNK